MQYLGHGYTKNSVLSSWNSNLIWQSILLLLFVKSGNPSRKVGNVLQEESNF